MVFTKVWIKKKADKWFFFFALSLVGDHCFTPIIQFSRFFMAKASYFNYLLENDVYFVLKLDVALNFYIAYPTETTVHS